MLWFQNKGFFLSNDGGLHYFRSDTFMFEDQTKSYYYK